MAAPGEKFPWKEKLLRSGFLIGAVLLHLIIFALVAGYVIDRTPPPEQTVDFTPKFTPQPTETPVTKFSDTTASSAAAVSLDPGNTASAESKAPVAILPGSNDIKIALPAGPSADGGSSASIPIHPPSKLPTHGLSPGRVKLIKEFEIAHRSIDKILNHDPAGDYPVYVASYADGDWACNTNLDSNGNIVAGSIPNLVAKIEEWTHRQVKAHVVARPLNIGGPDLLNEKPPFIFITGHKDFVLTAQEVQNLQDYVAMGGLIWGDNAEAGSGSRFDVAFRREMKRVISTGDLQPFDTSAEIYREHYQFDQMPQGMNYRDEPIEHVDLDDKPAIIYTPDDYSDLYTMRILPGDEQIQGSYPAKNSPLVSSELYLSNSRIFFRNYTLPSSLAAQHLGLNIVTYLITRFDDVLQLEP